MPARVDGSVKERLLKLVDDTVDAGWAHTRVCEVLEISDERMHRWRARQREHGTLSTAHRAATRCTDCWPGNSRRSST